MQKAKLPSRSSLGAIVLLSFFSTSILAQPGPGAASDQPQRSPREAAQVDITGHWVALVTEDWLWRMITPPKGDATSVPLNPRGQLVTDSWDPVQDVANGEQCRPFGAAGLMRMPLRLSIGWDDDQTLKIETDVGQQTRLLHFDRDADRVSERSRQGYSRAEWTRPVGFDLRTAFGGPPPSSAPPMGALKVVTGNLRAGYLRKNGVPYSENAEMTEYFSRISAFGNDYLTVLTIVRDPEYLANDFVTSSQFKLEPDDSNWNPVPCRTTAPLAAGQ